MQEQLDIIEREALDRLNTVDGEDALQDWKVAYLGRSSRLMGVFDQIGTLPKGERERLEVLAEQTRQRHEKLKKSITGLQDSLDFLRLSIKYLLFDLEATKRENESLRRMLERGNEPPPAPE